MNWPFDPVDDRNQWTSISAGGYAFPVSGCVYDGARLDGGLPIGGLGTGYFTIEGNGTIGHASIYNEIVPPRPEFRDWLTIAANGSVTPLSAGRIAYWGHYPIVDLVADLPDAGVCVGIRALAPFVVGDERASGTPVGLFEVRVENTGPETTELELRLALPAPAEDSTHQAKLLGQSVVEQAPNSGRGTVSLAIAPGAVERVRFVFAWYAPHWRDSGSEAHVHRYGTRHTGAEAIATSVLEEFDDLVDRVIDWQEEIYRTDYPAWLQDALVQSFYSLAKNSVWLAKTRADEWWDPVHGWFTHNESHTGCPITETMVCRMHGHFPTLLFFPDLEATSLEAFRHFQISDGEIPFSFGMNTSMRDPRYHCQHPLNSGQFAQMVYRLYRRTGNREQLAGLYPAAKRGIRYQQTLDDDGDGLVNDQAHVGPGEAWPANQFYDIWPWWGTSAYVAGTWLATLAIGRALARETGDTEFERECDEWLERGVRSYDQKLWNGDYYRLWSDPDGKGTSEICLGNQLMAEWCLAVAGLDGVLPSARVQQALEAVERLNMRATAHGLVNGVTPEGAPYDSGFSDGENDHARQVFVGENLCAAMTFIYRGHRETGVEIARRIYEAIALVSRSPWRQRCLISSSTGMPVWGEDYYSNMVVWALPAALEDGGVHALGAPEGLAGRMIAAASL